MLRDKVLPTILSEINGDKDRLYAVLKPQLQLLRLSDEQFLKSGNSSNEVAQLVAGILSTAMYRLGSLSLKNVSNAIGSLCKEPMVYGYFKDAHEKKREYPYFHHGHGHFKLGLDFLDVAASPNDPGAFTGHHTNIDRSNMGFMIKSWIADPSLEEKSWHYPKTQSDLTGHAGAPPYALSGPFGIGALLSCVESFDDFPFYRFGSQPWTSGTLADDVVNSGYAIVDVFNSSCAAEVDCSGRKTGGYTHRDVLYFTSPQRTPYTYDTLEQNYDFHDECRE